MQTEKKRPVQSVNEQTSLLQFHGSEIAFEEINGKLMVNATQMAKSFGKQPIEWLRFQQAKDLINTIAKVRNHSLADLKQVRRGGNNPGTWLQEDVALLFAQWLSPDFYLACNDKLKEIITQQALIAAAPIKYEVNGLIHEGKPFFAYTEALEACGASKRSTASRRRKKHPEHFRLIYGRLFITGQYFDLMKGYYDWKFRSNQLKLSV
jgi:hypothetical protein